MLNRIKFIFKGNIKIVDLDLLIMENVTVKNKIEDNHKIKGISLTDGSMPVLGTAIRLFIKRDTFLKRK